MLNKCVDFRLGDFIGWNWSEGRQPCFCVALRIEELGFLSGIRGLPQSSRICSTATFDFFLLFLCHTLAHLSHFPWAFASHLPWPTLYIFKALRSPKPILQSQKKYFLIVNPKKAMSIPSQHYLKKSLTEIGFNLLSEVLVLVNLNSRADLEDVLLIIWAAFPVLEVLCHANIFLINI